MPAKYARRNEQPSPQTRTESLERYQTKWYFRTREGVQVGPYDTTERAREQSAELRSQLAECASGRDALEAIRLFVLQGLQSGEALTPRFTRDVLAQ